MDLGDYIKQAQVKYPNGYADYSVANPEDTPDSWNELLGLPFSGEVKVADIFTITDFSDMPDWSREKLWTFLGWIAHNASKRE